jgi:hypothetical protein
MAGSRGRCYTVPALDPHETATAAYAGLVTAFAVHSAPQPSLAAR